MCSMSAPPAPRCARPACWPGSGRRLAGGGGRGSSWSGSAAVPEGLAAAVGCGPLCALCTCPPRVQLSPSAGRRAQGLTDSLGRGSRSPEPACAPPTLDRSAPASEPGGWDAAPRSQSATAWMRWVGCSDGGGLSCLSRLQFQERSWSREPQRKTRVGAAHPVPTPAGRGVVWVGPASPAAAALCASGVSSDRLLHSPPRPPLLPLARASSPSPCGILHPGRGGRGGCRSEDAQGLSSSWTRAAELNGRVPASECGCRLWGRPAGALPELGCC